MKLPSGIIAFVISIIFVVSALFITFSNPFPISHINKLLFLLLGFSSFVFSIQNFKNNNTYYGLTNLIVSLGCFILLLHSLFQ